MAASGAVRAAELDLSGRSFLLVGVGVGGRRVCQAWMRQLGRAGRPARFWALDRPAGCGGELAGWLAGARVGMRLLLAGPRADVLTLAAQARALHLLPEEITSVEVDAAELPIFCVHCRVTSRLAARPGCRVHCPGCRRELEVHPHVSGHRGSYLAAAPTPADGA